MEILVSMTSTYIDSEFVFVKLFVFIIKCFSIEKEQRVIVNT